MNRLRELAEWFRSLDDRTRRRFLISTAAVVILALLWSLVDDRILALAKKRTKREADLAEMMLLSSRYRQVKFEADRLTNRMAAARPDDSPAKIVEETGIGGKNVQVRPLKVESVSGLTEEAAEVRTDALTANDAVNLIYKIEKGARPVAVRKALVKTRFDDPSKVDLVLNISVVKAAPGAK